MNFRVSSKVNACPVCAREKDGDCRSTELGALVYCHTIQSAKKDELVNGYRYLHHTDKGAGWGVWMRWKESDRRAERRLSPEKERKYLYCNRGGGESIAVHRQKGMEMEFWQSYLIGDKWYTPKKAEAEGLGDQIAEMKSSIPIYRYPEVQKAIANNQPIFWVEGEKVADALWALGIAATTTIGGSGAYKSWGTYKSDLKDADVIICPDRDEVGMKYANQVYEDEPQARWLYAFPKSPLWNISLPKSDGLDVVDWIEDGATVQQILGSAEPKRVAAESKKAKRESKMSKLFAYIEECIGDDLRLNLLTDKFELNGEAWPDQFYRFQIMQSCDVDLSEQDAHSFSSVIAKRNAYHPIKDWLDEIYELYGDTTVHLLDAPARLFFKTTDPLYDLYLKNQLIAAVARIYEPGCKVDFATLLQGSQGMHKSTFWKELAGEGWFDDSVTSDLENKDELSKLHKCWFEELAEFDRITNRKEASVVKSYVSRQVDCYRAPYDRSVEDHPRQMILVGSVNPSEFLMDETGNRRFQVIPITELIDTDLVKKLRPRLWAAAISLYKKGVTWYLSQEQEQIAIEYNKAFEVQDLWTSTIDEYLSEEVNLIEKDGEVYVLPSKILLHLGIDVGRQDQVHKKRLSRILTQLGWVSRPNSIRLTGFKNTVRVWSRNKPEISTVTDTVTDTVTSPTPYSITLIKECHGSHGSNTGLASKNGSGKNHPQISSDGAQSDRDTVTNFETPSQQEVQRVTQRHATRKSAVTNSATVTVSTKESRFQPIAVGDAIAYVGNKYKDLQGEILTVTEIDSVYLTTMKADGSYSTWLPISDVKKVSAKGGKNNA